APGRCGGACCHLGAPAGDHGRADRRTRGQGDAAGPRSHPSRSRTWTSGHPDQPRHAARVRARRPDSHHAPRPPRGSGHPQATHDAGSCRHHDRGVTERARPGPDDERKAPMSYVPASDRYERMPYRRTGRSGLLLPAISFGLWQNFGTERPLETSRAIIRRAFDLGVTHFDLANNYGPPYGSAEETFGRLMKDDLRPYRDELVISTKAGYDMWPGPYGEWGSRKYLLASLDQSLRRMGLEYVDIFYSHRFDPETPLEETMGAVHTAVRSGKALYAGISSYSAERTLDAISLLRRMGTPLLIHQPSYSMLNRWIEGGLLDVLGREGVGCIAFSPLAQGVLTGKY